MRVWVLRRHPGEAGEQRQWRLRAVRVGGLAAARAVHRHAALQLVQLRATHTLSADMSEEEEDALVGPTSAV